MVTKSPLPDEQKEDRAFRGHPGDVGVIAIAALFTIALILMFFMKSPLAKLDEMRATAQKAERQKEIQKAVDSGVVSVGIAPAKKP